MWPPKQRTQASCSLSGKTLAAMSGTASHGSKCRASSSAAMLCASGLRMESPQVQTFHTARTNHPPSPIAAWPRGGVVTAKSQCHARAFLSFCMCCSWSFHTCTFQPLRLAAAYTASSGCCSRLVLPAMPVSSTQAGVDADMRLLTVSRSVC